MDGAGRPVYRIGTSAAATLTIEDCNGCGPQRIRIQTREHGLSIDQVVLSPDRYLTASPGALKKDTVIVPQVQ